MTVTGNAASPSSPTNYELIALFTKNNVIIKQSTTLSHFIPTAAMRFAHPTEMLQTRELIAHY